MWWSRFQFQTLFQKSKVDHTSGSIAKSFIHFDFIGCPSQARAMKIYRNYMQTNYFTWNKAFIKTKQGPELFSLSYIMHDFRRKIFLTFCSINWSNFIVWMSLLLEILGSSCFFPDCNTISFEIFTLAFLLSRFHTWPKMSG